MPYVEKINPFGFVFWHLTGGFSLAARWTGKIETIAFVEIDKFCQKVLNKNFPGVPIIDDIREVTGERIRGIVADTESDRWGTLRPESEGQQRESGFGNGHIDILTGGFPCQPFSAAGKRKGKNDDRFLWPEMLRVISEVRPTWIIGENVAGLINMAQPGGDAEMGGEADTEEETCSGEDADGILWGIIDDLEDLGYDVQPFVIPACAVNAPHRRDRVWIVAHTKGVGSERRPRQVREEDGRQVEQMHPESDGTDRSYPHSHRQRERTGLGEVPQAHGEVSQRDNDAELEQSNRHAPDTAINGLHDIGAKGWLQKESFNSINSRSIKWSEPWLEVATRLCRMDAGVSNRVDRLKALGNAIVPQVVYPIFKAIVEIEKSESLVRAAIGNSKG